MSKVPVVGVDLNIDRCIITAGDTPCPTVSVIVIGNEFWTIVNNDVS